MAATSSSNKTTGSIDGRSQAVQAETQCRRDLYSTVWPFWHHRARRALPFTKTTPPRRHITPRPRHCTEETGTDPVQRHARNITTALHIRRLYSINQQPRPSPPTPGQGGRYYRSRFSRRRSISPDPATLRDNPDLPTGDPAPYAHTGSYHQHLPLSWSSNRSPDYHAEVGDGCFIQCQTCGHSTGSSQTNQPMLKVGQTETLALRLSTKPTTRLLQTAETSETTWAGQEENSGWIPQGVQTDSAAHHPPPPWVAEAPPN